MRSQSKYKSFIRCSLNPHPTHFVLKYLDRYIGEDGFAIDSFSSRMAYYVFDKGSIITSWSYKELRKKYPDKNPRKYTFVKSSLSDNPALLESNPDYAADLEANDPANAAMLLLGNWKYAPAANGYFDRNTISVIEREPHGCTYYRAWDKAATKPSSEGGDSASRDPDYTASIMFAIDKQNIIYILGNYVRDDDNQQIARFREKSGVRDEMILRQALHDGDHVYQILPRDLGAAGLTEYAFACRALQEQGVTVKEDKAVSNQSKGKRFEPFASACYSGNVFWVKPSFDTATWEYMILELENFDGRKNNGYHDDLVDCFSSAYATAMKTKRFNSFHIPKVTGTTLLHKMNRN
jgi:phage terminase large subunit-like protein